MKIEPGTDDESCLGVKAHHVTVLLSIQVAEAGRLEIHGHSPQSSEFEVSKLCSALSHRKVCF